MDGSWPEVSRMTADYEEVSKDAYASVKHQEQTLRKQESFFQRVDKLYGVFIDMGNPFQKNTAELLDTKVVTTSSSVTAFSVHYQCGSTRFADFIKGLEREDGCQF